MLVSLGTNQALGANSSITLPYACRSISKVFVKVDDTTGSEALQHTVTVQLGQRTIMNGVSAWGCIGMQALQGGHESSTSEAQYQINFGTHQLLDNENVYVTIQAGVSALDAVDVSALVDEPIGEFPVRYTEYSDNVFTAENCLTAISYASNKGTVDEDAYNIEIRDAVNSSSPSLISANNWYSNEIINDDSAGYYGLLLKQTAPLTTTFNYSASAATDRILVASQMGTNARAVRQGKRQQAITTSQVGK